MVMNQGVPVSWINEPQCMLRNQGVPVDRINEPQGNVRNQGVQIPSVNDSQAWLGSKVSRYLGQMSRKAC